MNAMAFVYILLCENNSLYTGYTTNLIRRFDAHRNGKVKYTRAFKPVEIVQFWEFESKSKAMKVEYWIKQQTRAKKELLIKQPEQLDILF